MKISEAGAGLPASRTRKTTKADKGESFRQHIQDETPSVPSGPAGSMPLSALSGMLAVQETPSSLSERRRAVMHGDTLLDELKELQIGLVQGWVSEDTLRSLSHMLDGPRPVIEDPELARLLDDIELRAAVELAKLDRRSP